MIQGDSISTFIPGFPVPFCQVKDINIIFHTITKTLLVKTLGDCMIHDGVVECKISQEESLRFTCGPVTRSVVVITQDGSRFELPDEALFVEKTSRNEVIT